MLQTQSPGAVYRVAASCTMIVTLVPLAWMVEGWSVLALMGVAADVGLLATAVVLGLMLVRARSIRAVVSAQQRGGLGGRSRGGLPISREVRAVLSEMELERRFANGIHVDWSPKTLQRLLAEELPATQVLVVSNREPYIHNRSNGAVALQIPASGLVAALEPLMRACGGHGLRTAQALPTAIPSTATIAFKFHRPIPLIRFAASGSQTTSRTATTTASPTRASGSPRTRCWTGPLSVGSHGTTSRRASRCRTRSSRVSTAACATSC